MQPSNCQHVCQRREALQASSLPESSVSEDEKKVTVVLDDTRATNARCAIPSASVTEAIALQSPVSSRASMVQTDSLPHATADRTAWRLKSLHQFNDECLMLVHASPRWCIARQMQRRRPGASQHRRSCVRGGCSSSFPGTLWRSVPNVLTCTAGRRAPGSMLLRAQMSPDLSTCRSENALAWQLMHASSSERHRIATKQQKFIIHFSCKLQTSLVH